uniref:Uncharacterized protein n=1 Tax=Anguilla anguilla TaxID=7936 RepID=A0A0E9URN6_ANGAN
MNACIVQLFSFTPIRCSCFLLLCNFKISK